jgi:hypothetical protein
MPPHVTGDHQPEIHTRDFDCSLRNQAVPVPSNWHDALPLHSFILNIMISLCLYLCASAWLCITVIMAGINQQGARLGSLRGSLEVGDFEVDSAAGS